MPKQLRVKSSKFVDETNRIPFKFNGINYFGYKGDTLASALLSNDEIKAVYKMGEKPPSI